MDALCVECHKTVRARQEALQCDTCDKWCHRTCGTGINRAMYRQMVKRQITIDWNCRPCISQTTDDVAPAESTRISGVNFDLGLSLGSGTLDCSSIHEETVQQGTTNSIPSAPCNMTYIVRRDAEEKEGTHDFADFAIPTAVEESSIQDVTPHPEQHNVTFEVTYQIVKGGTKRGKDKLVDSSGYTYNQRKSSNPEYRQDWECTVRSKVCRCSATVRQMGNTFKRGPKDHIHQPEKGALLRSKISAEAKVQAAQDVFKSAGAIVQQLITDNREEAFLPKPDNLIRAANLFRQKMRPKDPVDLCFDVNTEYIPKDFFQKDIVVNGRRHLIFSTPQQMKILKRAKRWFIDATFKVVKMPFTQLFSIHAFLKHGESLKQVPLLYVTMSGKSKEDYKSIFVSIKEILEEQVDVLEVVLDFEAAMWGAIREIFPYAMVKGCVFHWVQAIWRHVQSLGLQEAYNKDEGSHHFIRKLMALPFVPNEHVLRLFLKISSSSDDVRLSNLCSYVYDTWIESSIWPPSTWSVFMRQIRTNNDVEGWHLRINQKAGRGQLQFYLLIDLLFEESKFVEAQTKLVRDDKVSRRQRAEYKRVNDAVNKLWDSFTAGESSSTDLLHGCAKIYGPIED